MLRQMTSRSNTSRLFFKQIVSETSRCGLQENQDTVPGVTPKARLWCDGKQKVRCLPVKARDEVLAEVHRSSTIAGHRKS